MATEITKNRQFQLLHCRLRPPRHGTPTNICKSCIPPESRVPGLYFSDELQNMHHLCCRVRYGRSRSSKVVDFGGSRKGIWDFLLVISDNLGLILHSFWDTATYGLKIADFFLPLLCLPPLAGVTPLEFLEKLYGS